MKRSEIDLQLDSWILDAAKKHKWNRIYVRDVTLFSFMKMIKGERAKISIWPTKMTVAAFLWYPKQGKIQKFRRNVRQDLMEKIFEDPFVHMESGYQRKIMYDSG